MRAISSSDLANVADGITSPVSLCWNTVIGTPQARWREITQSGLDSIMPRSRLLARSRHELGLADGLQGQLAQGLVPAALSPCGEGWVGASSAVGCPSP